MFDTFMGLPAHALIVHGAVVLAPLFAILSLVYAVVPRVRGKLDWAVVLSGLGAAGAIFAARQSGLSFEAARFPDEIPPVVLEHSSFGNPLLFTTLGLTVAALALVFITRPKGEAATGGGGSSVVSLGLTVITVVLAAIVAYYAIRAGHSGATAVWS
jgi:hypothetical protein